MFIMYSRLALRSGSLAAALTRQNAVVTFVPRASAATDAVTKKEDGERDLVNFPRPARLVEPGKVRLGFIPDEWFTFFHNKTGVTGPYLFGIGLSTFLVSKEFYVMEHEYVTGLSILLMIIFATKKFGPGVAKAVDSEIDKIEEGWQAYRNGAINGIGENIKNEELAQWQAVGQKWLFEAKKENVALQLEAAYRERMYVAYQDVKRRLDYQLVSQLAEARLKQKHMANWIVDNVVKSITPQQEKESITNCISELKRLSADAKVGIA
ncbi:PREDICTED: ATP synthase subunit b, mitochondrial-like [Priapulus caudatus]|uniref:ATP synthase subunit b n=1 Tax=Priapulus caudatus TaxID=37621 RepID=A0ABM1DXL7_PRICU|nr:PREDICTED: ATP synthase subunit b, mitochondrial-like [Priapulus caudatus]